MALPTYLSVVLVIQNRKSFCSLIVTCYTVIVFISLCHLFLLILLQAFYEYLFRRLQVWRLSPHFSVALALAGTETDADLSLQTYHHLVSMLAAVRQRNALRQQNLQAVAAAREREAAGEEGGGEERSSISSSSSAIVTLPVSAYPEYYLTDLYVMLIGMK